MHAGHAGHAGAEVEGLPEKVGDGRMKLGADIRVTVQVEVFGVWVEATAFCTPKKGRATHWRWTFENRHAKAGAVRLIRFRQRIGEVL